MGHRCAPAPASPDLEMAGTGAEQANAISATAALGSARVRAAWNEMRIGDEVDRVEWRLTACTEYR